MKITDYEKNHGKFVHEDWLQKIINLVPNLTQILNAKSIEAIHFNDSYTSVDYIDKDGNLVEDELIGNYLTSNITGDGTQTDVKNIEFDTDPTTGKHLMHLTFTDKSQNIKTFNLDDDIRFAFDNSSDKFIATDTKLGIVKYSKSNPIKVKNDGQLDIDTSKPLSNLAGVLNLLLDRTGLDIDAQGQLYLKPATSTAIGGVMPDGTTITVDGNGKISAAPQGAVWTETSIVADPDAAKLFDIGGVSHAYIVKSGGHKFLVAKISMTPKSDITGKQTTLVTMPDANIPTMVPVTLNLRNNAFYSSTYLATLNGSGSIMGYPTLKQSDITSVDININTMLY